MNLKTIAYSLAHEHGLPITYLWNNQDVEAWAGADHVHIDILKSTPFFAIMHPTRIAIKIDLDTLPSDDTGVPLEVDHLNVLCHELGHLIAHQRGTPAPQEMHNLTLDDVIANEKAANEIGIELYKRYKDPSTYWNNHEDLERMEGYYRRYTGGIG